MQVKDRLPTISARIRDHAIAGFSDAAFASHLSGEQEELARQGLIDLLQFGERDNMTLRHDEQVGWGARLDIAKRNRVRGFGNELGSEFAADDLTENAIVRFFSGHKPNVPWSRATIRRIPAIRAERAHYA